MIDNSFFVVGFTSDAINPDWSKAEKVHDWRNYVSDEVKEMWPSFTYAQRIAIAKMANEPASNEQWD